MSLKGAMPKAGLRDEPFMNNNDEEIKGQPSGAANTGKAAAATDGTAGNKETSASKEPVMGLDSNNNQN